MSVGLLFWVIMIIWLCVGISRNQPAAPRWIGWGGDLILFILLFLLGWHSFGFIVRS